MQIAIPDYAQEAYRLLNCAGYEAYFVGGCVRDALRNHPPHDWDLCTNALPEETKSVFNSETVLEFGVKHGTITVVLSGHPIEITTYRTDGSYSDNRRPNNVRFVRSIREDLARRDFTMNAITYRPDAGIYDPFNGAADVKNKIIRCVGEPDQRFGEDALRILRAIRFAAALGFSLETQTAQSAVTNRSLLSHLSAERIRSELVKLLCGDHAVPVLLQERKIIAAVLPEVRACFDFPQQNPHHCYDVWEHICRSTAFVPPVPVLRMAMLLHDIGKPKCFTLDDKGTAHFKMHPQISAEISKKILTRLRFDHRAAARILQLVREHDNRPEQAENPRKFVLKLLSEYGTDFFADYLQIRRADTLAQSDYLRAEKLTALDMLNETFQSILVKEDCFTQKQLAINGKDLQDAGFLGKEIGEALQNALNAVINGAVPNEKAALLADCFRHKSKKTTADL